jgi:hypothetical protein
MENTETWDLYEYIEQNELLKDGFELCENDQQRETLISYTKTVCKLYQPLIDNARQMLKTDLDKERFIKMLMGDKSANRST